MVEPQFENVDFVEGEEVLIVGREGEIFAAVATDSHRLLGAE